MNRTISKSLLAVALVLLVAASFAGGRQLRRAAAGPVVRNARVSSLPDAKLGGHIEILAEEQGGDTSPIETFRDVYQYVKTEYVEKVTDDTKLANGAVKAMLQSLDDPKTRFLEADQYKALQEQLDGAYTGIGVALTVVKQKKGAIDYRKLGVLAPVPGGPADQAGVRAGDIITHINGKWVIAYNPMQEIDSKKEMSDEEYRKLIKDIAKRITEGISLPKALDTLSAKDGKPVSLVLEREGVPEPIKLSVTTAEASIEPVEVKSLADGVTYIRVTAFGPKAESALSDSLKQAASKPVVLDLRDNPGAPAPEDSVLPPSAWTILNRLARSGRVATAVLKGGQSQAINVDSNGAAPGKVAVLVNRGTANAAELVAAALKESGATLVGTRTFGDSTIQKLIPLRGGTAMTVSAGKYLTAKGGDFTGKGLTPDVEAAAARAETETDPAVRKAVALVTGA